MIDAAVLVELAVCGLVGAPWAVIAFGVGVLAGGSYFRLRAIARRAPHINSRRALVSVSIDAALHAVAAALAAFIVGAVAARVRL